MPQKKTSRAEAPAAAWERYRRKRDAAARALAALGSVPTRLGGKRVSNLFRHGSRAPARRLDLSAFRETIAVDPEARVADAEGLIRFDDLLAATLRSGLAPPVVPQLRSITLGGAVSGGGIEATSFRHGFVHERVLEMDVLLASGEVATCRPDNERSDLFYGMANSYGTLGYALRVRLPLEPAGPFVALRHRRFDDRRAFFEALGAACARGRSPGAGGPDFVEGVAFAPDDLVLTTARYVETAPRTSNYKFMRLYYQSLRRKERDYLRTADFFWRWDTDWFWRSEAFGMERAPLRFVAGLLGLLKSTTYWKLRDGAMRRGLVERFEREPGEDVIQDVEIPLERAAEFLDFLQGGIGLGYVWICPTQSPPQAESFPLYRTDPDTLYVNFGFWERVGSTLSGGESLNRRVERKTRACDGMKSLYSTACYPEEEFWEIYNGPAYRRLKARYDPQGRLGDLYRKCVLGE